MIRIIEYQGQPVAELLNRAAGAGRDVSQAVSAILDDVKRRGDAAVLDCCERFDGTRPQSLLAAPGELDAACARVAPELMDTMRLAARNIERFHSQQKRSGFVDASVPGVVAGQRVLPLSSVGLYVPGGTARYPSSVLMNAIPARIAGVENIVMTTPPGPGGQVPAVVLAAAGIAGVKTVVKAGGAQAVAALAFGTQTVPRVDKIVGPGNLYVATAKQLCYARGLCDIDMVAGPSEILVVADADNDPVHIAADLLSQAEHDRLSSAWLVTTSMALARDTAREVERQLSLLSRGAIARESIALNGRAVVVDSLETAMRLANEIAPEHLELCVGDPFGLLPLAKNAGSVFLGRCCPEALGDYLAGPNHTLPTGGTARYSSPLGVDDFCRRSSYLYYTPGALRGAARDVMRFAACEGLDAHANAVRVRVEGGSGTAGDTRLEEAKP